MLFFEACIVVYSYNATEVKLYLKSKMKINPTIDKCSINTRKHLQKTSFGILNCLQFLRLASGELVTLPIEKSIRGQRCVSKSPICVLKRKETCFYLSLIFNPPNSSGLCGVIQVLPKPALPHESINNCKCELVCVLWYKNNCPRFYISINEDNIPTNQQTKNQILHHSIYIGEDNETCKLEGYVSNTWTQTEKGMKVYPNEGCSLHIFLLHFPRQHHHLVQLYHPATAPLPIQGELAFIRLDCLKPKLLPFTNFSSLSCSERQTATIPY